MAELWEMKNNGVKICTDDGDDIQDLGLYRRVFQYCRTHGLTLMSHAENHDLKEGHCMHEGWVSTQMGLPANPPSTEVSHVAKLLTVLEELPTPLHFTHMSTAGAMRLLKDAKARGLPVTVDVTPHHLTLTDAANMGYNTQAKVCPPLRSEEHRQALLRAVQDGTVDAIASDHAPHTLVEKFVEYESAAVGMVGLETLWSVCYTHLVRTGQIPLERLVALLTVNPARIMREDVGVLRVGGDADIAVFDLEKEYVIDKNTFCSKGRNTPFHGDTVYGLPTDTVVGGRIVMRDGVVVPL